MCFVAASSFIPALRILGELNSTESLDVKHLSSTAPKSFNHIVLVSLQCLKRCLWSRQQSHVEWVEGGKNRRMFFHLLVYLLQKVEYLNDDLSSGE